MPRLTSEPGRRRRKTPVSLMAALALMAIALAAGRVAIADPRDRGVNGDQASFVYNALSLQGGDLSYNEADQARWERLGWSPQPSGLFLQRWKGGWAFAKPFGYSLLLAGPLALFGIRAVSLVGALLVLGYAATWLLACRLRWSARTSIVIAATATVASHAWFYGFVAHADLFVAVLVGAVVVGCVRTRLLNDSRAFVIASGVAALLMTEKVTAFAAVIPLLIVAGWHRPALVKLLAITVMQLTIAITVLPYFHYSDGASWSAYGGERYYAVSVTPWSGGGEADLQPSVSPELIKVGHVAERLAEPSPDIPQAALTYAVGRHTGVLTFTPLVAFLLIAAALARRRRRHPGIQARGRGRSTAPDAALAVAAASGLAGYAAIYLLLFTDNYFGGAQSIGSRYFLQISVLAAAVAVGAAVSTRAVMRCSALATSWAIAVLGPHLLRPERAFYDLDQTSAVQRLLPLDTTQGFPQGH